jgi:hypothetical protein
VPREEGGKEVGASKFPPFLGTLHSSQNKNMNIVKFWAILDTNEIQFFNYILFVLSTCQNIPSSV